MSLPPSGSRFARMRQYRRNFRRMYPDAAEQIAAAAAGRKLAGALLWRFAPLLAALWFVGCACGWFVRALVAR